MGRAKPDQSLARRGGSWAGDRARDFQSIWRGDSPSFQERRPAKSSPVEGGECGERVERAGEGRGEGSGRAPEGEG